MQSRLLALLVLLAAVTVVSAAPALAHVELEESEPAAGATLRTSPPEVFVRLTGSVVEGSVRILVRGPGGARIETGDPQSGASAAAVPLPPLTRNGRYVVTYDGQSTDGHAFEGRFTFRFKARKDAAAPEVTQPATEPAGGPASPGTGVTDAPAPGAPSVLNEDGSLPVPLGIAAVAGVLALGVVLLRARR